MKAITRPVSTSFAACELTHREREPIRLDRARAQHAVYEEALSSLGCDITRLPALDDHPDAVFVEDTAIVLAEGAVITRPGAASRRGETISVRAALERDRPVHVMTQPGSLDGGDVLRLGSTLLVGLSGRSNSAGVEQLREFVRPWGYDVETVEVTSCLHLKSAVTAIDNETVVLNPRWIDPDRFAGLRVVETDPDEPDAANVLALGERVLCAAAFARTNERVANAGFDVMTVDVSEIAKAEGALTCCSLLLP